MIPVFSILENSHGECLRLVSLQHFPVWGMHVGVGRQGMLKSTHPECQDMALTCLGRLINLPKFKQEVSGAAREQRQKIPR